MDDCIKVTSYFGERTFVDGRFFSEALLDLFGEHGIASSMVLRATAGFGLTHHLRSDQTLTMSEDPSVVVVATDLRSRLEPLLPAITALQPRGMLTVERARSIRGREVPPALPDGLGEATKLTIALGRHERIGGAGAYRAICEVLHHRGVSGASVLVGVDGTVSGRRERARVGRRNRSVPATVIAVGRTDQIEGVLPAIHGLLEEPTITVERVRVCKREGELLARPHLLPDHDDTGLGLWQKLMIFTSESQLHQGEPVHRAIVRRLRETNARGATVLRGSWGYHGDHAPHGDRWLQIGRNVPVVTVVVDTPSYIASLFDVVDELTTEHGLVTSEMVPAMRYFGSGTDRGGVELARFDY
ncbi:MAG TPA: DUF190 domain-containing protein [Marmoricola sp.]